VHLGKARFSFPPSQTAVRQHAVQARHLRQITIGTGPGGVRAVGGVRVVCLPWLRPPLLGGVLFYTAGPLLALSLALARGNSAITCQSPYEAFGVIALSRVLPRRLRPPVRIEVHADWRTAPRLYGSRSRLVLAPFTDRICRWTIPRATLVRTIGDVTTSWVREANYDGPIERYLEFSDYGVFGEAPTVPPPERPRVLFVGVLERYKGVDVLLTAWPAVLEAIPDAMLTIVGSGTQSKKLLRSVTGREFEHTVRFIDPVPQNELRELVDQASCLVLPSRSEGLGRVVIEAMARARPVVGSSVGGIPELIDDGRTGWLVPPGDVASLSAAMSSVLSDPSAAEKMGHEARQDFERLDPAAEYEAGVIRFADWIRTSAPHRNRPSPGGCAPLRGSDQRPHGGSPTPRIGLVSHWDWVLDHFWLHVARGLQDAGADVVLICPRGQYVDRWHSMGFDYEPWPVTRRGLNPLGEATALAALTRIYQRENLSAVHHFTVKPIVHGTVAAKLARVPVVVNNLSGLGYLFSDDARAKSARIAAHGLLRYVLVHSRSQLVLQNSADVSRLRDLGLLPETRTTLIPGTGVDLGRHRPGQSNGDSAKPPTVLLAARLLRSKGVEDFVRCAQTIHAEGIPARFIVAGVPDDGNPDTIRAADIEHWRRTSPVDFIGHIDDLASVLQSTQIAVLPTRYPEGVPTFLLEAAAAGVPAVATDLAGCRIAVRHGTTGFLYPSGSPDALTGYVRRLLEDRSLSLRLGRQARALAEREFGESKIVEAYLDLYRSAAVVGEGKH